MLTYIEDVSAVGNLLYINLDKGHNIFDRKILVIYLVLALMLIDIVALSALKQHKRSFLNNYTTNRNYGKTRSDIWSQRQQC